MKSAVTGKWYNWILLIIVCKGVIFYLLSTELGDPNDSFIGLRESSEGTGDANSYLFPVENLLKYGDYSPDYRMPGYVPVYYFLRLCFDSVTSRNLMLLVQLLLDAISVYVLALVSYRLFKSERIFYLVLFAYLISTYTQIFDLYLLSESLTTSLSIFAVYFLVKGLQERKHADLLMCGFWTTWVIFLRPVYAPYICLFSLITFFFFGESNERKWGIRLKAVLFLLLPFIIIDGIWMMRNYSRYSKIQPLTKSMYYPEVKDSYFLSAMEFLQSWGGSYVFWDPSAEIRLLGFEVHYGEKIVTNPNVHIPDYIYTKAFNKDSLTEVTQLILSMENKSVSPDSSVYINNLIREKLDRYTASVKEEHPFMYHVGSRLRYSRLFLLHSGTYNLMRYPWQKLSILKNAIKLFYSALYLFTLFGGFIGSIFLLKGRWKTLAVILPLLTLYSLIIFPWVLRLVEMRYFVPTYPFMLICAMYVTNEHIFRLKRGTHSVKSKTIKIASAI